MYFQLWHVSHRLGYFWIGMEIRSKTMSRPRYVIYSLYVSLAWYLSPHCVEFTLTESGAFFFVWKLKFLPVPLSLDKVFPPKIWAIHIGEFLKPDMFNLRQYTVPTEFIFFLVQFDAESTLVGKTAIANLLGGIGYFYGRSKIALPRGSRVSPWDLCS